MTYDGYNSFLTIVDDYSRATWTFLLKSKANVSQVLQVFITMVKTQFKTSVKQIRSDSGTEFFNSNIYNLLTSLGILQQSSCFETPQQNGRVERKHRYLLELARVLRCQTSLPIRFWGDCLLTVTYLINRLPSSVIKFKTPFEMLIGSPPRYDHLKTLGCLCYVSTSAHNRDKFSPRAQKCIFLGYPYYKKAYKVYNLSTYQVFSSRDVQFYEANFPFKHMSDTPNSTMPLFPASHMPPVDDEHNDTGSAVIISENRSTMNNFANLNSETPVATAMPTANTYTRPARTRTIPTKFKDYTGLPTTLQNPTASAVIHTYPLSQFYTLDNIDA